MQRCCSFNHSKCGLQGCRGCVTCRRLLPETPMQQCHCSRVILQQPCSPFMLQDCMRQVDQVIREAMLRHDRAPLRPQPPAAVLLAVLVDRSSPQGQGQSSRPGSASQVSSRGGARSSPQRQGQASRPGSASQVSSQDGGQLSPASSRGRRQPSPQPASSKSGVHSSKSVQGSRPAPSPGRGREGRSGQRRSRSPAGGRDRAGGRLGSAVLDRSRSRRRPSARCAGRRRRSTSRSVSVHAAIVIRRQGTPGCAKRTCHSRRRSVCSLLIFLGCEQGIGWGAAAVR